MISEYVMRKNQKTGGFATNNRRWPLEGPQKDNPMTWAIEQEGGMVIISTVCQSKIEDADVYTSHSQMQSPATKYQNSQLGKIDETKGEAQRRKGIIPERYAQKVIESDPKAHVCTQIPCSHERKTYLPWTYKNGETSLSRSPLCSHCLTKARTVVLQVKLQWSPIVNATPHLQ